LVTKLSEAEEAARHDSSLERNVKALRDAQPERLGPSKISVPLGASWVPDKYISEFAHEIGAGVGVSFINKGESWHVPSAEGTGKRSRRSASSKYGTADRSPAEILELILNSKPITIKVTDKDRKTYTDEKATEAARNAAKKIQAKFASWVWSDSDRTTDLVNLYNERFNNIAGRKYNGDHLTLPGVSLRFKLHPHQRRAIWRQIVSGNTYLAHAVGAGKTIEMIAGGMEQKRLGLIKKPIYVVPNHMLEQFANEFMELYPLANIMVADDANFTGDRRRAFIAAAAMNSPDAVVITASAFQKIGVKEESVKPIRDEILQELQDELDDSEGDRVKRSRLQQQIEAAEQYFDKIVSSHGKDSAVSFEDMGIDMIYADEAHQYRKLDFATNQKVKGIDPVGSGISMGMYIKTRILEKMNPGRSLVFASGTADIMNP
jgi:N12 class adenine-specific DNA methylase